MSETAENRGSRLIDFDFIGNSFNQEDMLGAYLEGRKDVQKEIESLIKNRLQTTAISSSLLREKLREILVNVRDMYLRIVDLKNFECLVIIDDEDFYNKEKRWDAYKAGRNVNDSIDDIDLTFSIMPFSENLLKDKITAEGFYFKYVKSTS